TRRVTMDGEDAGRTVLDDHRRRGNRPGAERAQGPDVSDRGLDELRGILHVRDSDRPLLDRREGRDRELVGIVADGACAWRSPLRDERETLSDAHEVAHRSERL